MVDTIAEKGWLPPSSDSETQTLAFFTGLTKNGTKWQWDRSGDDLTGKNNWFWGDGQPSGDGNCASLWFDGELGGRWNDHACSMTVGGAICENGNGMEDIILFPKKLTHYSTVG